MRTAQEAHSTEAGLYHVPIANITVYGEPLPSKGDQSPQFKEVSWSWWLSKPVQEYLDNQFFLKSYFGGLGGPDRAAPTRDGEQVEMLNRVCDWLRDPKIASDPLVEQCKGGIQAFLQAR